MANEYDINQTGNQLNTLNTTFENGFNQVQNQLNQINQKLNALTAGVGNFSSCQCNLNDYLLATLCLTNGGIGGGIGGMVAMGGQFGEGNQAPAQAQVEGQPGSQRAAFVPVLEPAAQQIENEESYDKFDLIIIKHIKKEDKSFDTGEGGKSVIDINHCKKILINLGIAENGAQHLVETPLRLAWADGIEYSDFKMLVLNCEFLGLNKDSELYKALH